MQQGLDKNPSRLAATLGSAPSRRDLQSRRTGSMLTDRNGGHGGPHDDSAEIGRDKLVHAISNPVRVAILELLERRIVATAPELRSELDAEVSLGLLAYHLRILCDGGCVVPERIPAMGAEPQMAYRAKMGRIAVDPVLESKVPVPTIEPDEFLHWRELQLDEVGQEQLMEILQLASRQLLVIKEQSQRRLEITETGGTRFVAGAIAFRSPKNGSCGGDVRGEGGRP